MTHTWTFVIAGVVHGVYRMQLSTRKLMLECGSYLDGDIDGTPDCGPRPVTCITCLTYAFANRHVPTLGA